jgi:hypothetical protein
MGAGLNGHARAHQAADGIVDMDAIDAEIEALKKSLRPAFGPSRWTEAMDRKLLALWTDYHKEDVSKAIGRPEKACRKRYRELMEATK